MTLPVVSGSRTPPSCLVAWGCTDRCCWTTDSVWPGCRRSDHYAANSSPRSDHRRSHRQALQKPLPQQHPYHRLARGPEAATTRAVAKPGFRIGLVKHPPIQNLARRTRRSTANLPGRSYAPGRAQAPADCLAMLGAERRRSRPDCSRPEVLGLNVSQHSHPFCAPDRSRRNHAAPRPPQSGDLAGAHGGRSWGSSRG
jgi:hypothetical protein